MTDAQPAQLGMIGLAVMGLEKSGVMGPASEIVYDNLRKAMYAQFKLNNELEIEGASNVPPQGGVILASNHQSWLDVQVLGGPVGGCHQDPERQIPHGGCSAAQ